ncbi:hypothetical protein ALPO108162_10430 [Alicyclobacillus pomorum]
MLAQDLMVPVIPMYSMHCQLRKTDIPRKMKEGTIPRCGEADPWVKSDVVV